jgi:protoporphyrinogen oxidase
LRSTLESRIAIIGAGPAGLSTAMYLKRRGYQHVTVLEKEEGVGGKCRSFEYDGHVYDLGANLTTPRYTTVRALAQQLGMTPRKIADRRIVNLSSEQFESLTDASLLERLVVRGGASFYSKMRHLTGIDRHGYAGLRDGVEQPFGDWLTRHGLGSFRELFAVLFIAYGYGEMDRLPAAYALKFFDRIHLGASIDTVLGQDVPFTMDFEEGFQELWERVDREFGIGTRRGVTVHEVHRSPRGVDIVFEQGGVRHDEHFDELILACPLTAALGFLDTSPDEDRLFRQLQYNDYFVTVAKLRGVADISTYVYPYARRFTPGWPTVFYPPVEGDDGVFVFYAYGDGTTSVDEVRQRIEATVESDTFQGELVEFLHTEHWKYFPHVSAEVMSAGYYDELEGLQGQFHTYYVGETLAFTLVELIMNHSRDLVERHF